MAQRTRMAADLRSVRSDLEILTMNVIDQWHGEGWSLFNGDSAEVLQGLETASIDFAVFSPPFAQLFTYSDSPRDLGNVKDDVEFFRHYRFISCELYRVLKPGRVMAVHCMDLLTTKATHGVEGLRDFSGGLVAHHTADGFVYRSRVTIDRCPQPLCDETLVATPSGAARIGRLGVGDLVMGANGQATEIIDIPFQGEQDVIRLTFSDGQTVDCGPGHLWTVRTSKDNKWQTITADEILKKGVLAPNGHPRWEIPSPSAMEYQECQSLPVHPRLLGAILADGNTTVRSVTITKDRELVAALPLPAGHTLTEMPGSERAGGRTASFRIGCPEWHRNDVLTGLRTLGLEGARAWEKFIPNRYLMASIEDRRELLCGLMDGDGKISTNGGVIYRTTSSRLAGDVERLVRSLGFSARVFCHEGGRYEGGIGRPLFTVSIRLNSKWCPFTLPRKAERWRDTRPTPRQMIVGIERLNERRWMTCITVAAPDGLFVLDNFIVTHNSLAIRHKAKSLLFVQLERDRAWSAPAFPDYLLIFRKPGENAVPVNDASVDREEWIRWARPVYNESDRADGVGTDAWYDIRETNTLNVSKAKDNRDERHLCPLSLDIIERLVRLYSNRGEVVLSPFAGVGSEGYKALELGRKFIGIELKESYAATAAQNLREAERAAAAPNLFSELAEVG